MENEPTMRVHMSTGDFLATPDNTALFRFAGQLAMYDHVFMLTDEEKELGTYIFNQNDAYEQMEDYIIEYDFPIHDNMRSVAECDQRAFEKFVQSQMTDIADFPPEWDA